MKSFFLMMEVFAGALGVKDNPKDSTKTFPFTIFNVKY